MSDKLIVALDTDKLEIAAQLIDKLSPVVKIFKVGSQLFTACGPQVVRLVAGRGAKVFLDLKFCDIPNTVAKAVKSAKDLGVYMLTVHTLGGREMLRAAVKSAGSNGPIILGVTLLTSLDKKDLEGFGIKELVANEVTSLAKMAKEEGLNGIICSAREIGSIRKSLGKDIIIVTPGIRPKDYIADDQKRIMQAKEAIAAGADYLVVGRPITQESDPFAAAARIIEEINNA